MNKKAPLLAAALLLPALLLAGCQDPNQNKQELQTAINKQAEIKQYAFAGDADVNLGTVPPTKDGNTIASSLVSMFMNGKMEWSGVSSNDPLQLEISFKSTPAATGTPLELPMLIKDNKMYVSFPLINKPDEYFVVDMTGTGTQAGQASLLSPDALKNVTGLSGAMLSSMISDMDGKWVHKAKQPAVLKDGTQGTLYTVDITDQNAKDMSAMLQKKLPDFIDKLQSAGVLSAEQADRMKHNSITVTAPGQLAVVVGPDGFVHDEKINMSYIESEPAGNPANRHLNLHQAYDQVNQNPKFTKEVPKQTRPFDDVLKLLAGKSAGANGTGSAK